MCTYKRRRILAAILTGTVCASVLLGGCRTPSAETLSDSGESQTASDSVSTARRQQLDSFLQTVNDRKEDIYNEEFLPFEEQWADGVFDWEDTFTQEEMEQLSTPPQDTPEQMSNETARQDIQMFFRLLRQGYGGYDYFGGEEVFDRLEDKALDVLPDGTVTPEQLIEAVGCVKEVVTDNNLKIGGVPMVQNQYETWFSDVYFDTPEQAEVVDSEWIRPSIAPDGRLCYTLAAVVTDEQAEKLPDEAVIDGENVSIDWQKWECTSLEDTVLSVTELSNGAPLLASRSMLADDDQHAVQLDALSRVGTDYRDVPLLVWDFRSNSGGSDSYFRGWFAGFTGMNPDMKVSYAARLTPLNKYLLNFVLATGWYTDYSEGLLNYRDGITFVLQDGQTADIGESMVNQLRSVTNTLTVGSTTKGAILTSNTVNVWLPGSGLQVQWGIKLQQVEKTGNPDGYGVEPDLWVPPEMALERVELLCGYYGLS